EHQRRALEAVRLAERFVDPFLAHRRRLLHLEERGAERLEAIARLFDELADEDGRIELHTFTSLDTSSSPINPEGIRAAPEQQAARSSFQDAGAGSMSSTATA